MRLISVDALISLMQVKESLSEQQAVQQIQQLLKPLEVTKVDRLIEIIFSASRDLQADEIEEPETALFADSNAPAVAADPVQYHEKCLDRICSKLGAPLVKQGRCTYSSADGRLRVLCIVSKEYMRGGAIRYWFAFRPSHKDFLEEAEPGYVALGCGSPELVLLIPADLFFAQLPKMRKTETSDRYYWHVEVFCKGKRILLNHPTDAGLDITAYAI